MKTYIHKFTNQEAEMYVEWALKYWTEKRDAYYTEHTGKCLSCKYNQECKKILI